MTTLEFTYWLEGYLEESAASSHEINPEKILKKIIEVRGSKYKSDSICTPVSYYQNANSAVVYEYITTAPTIPKRIDKNEITQKFDSNNKKK